MKLTEDEKFVRDEVAKIYNQLVINCMKTCGDGYERWGHDLLPMTIEMFLSKDVKTQLKVIADNKLENYITYMMGLQLKSSSSRFWHHYRKDTNKYRELFPNYNYRNHDPEYAKPFEDEEDEITTCIKKAVENLNPYERMIVNEVIIEGETYKKVSETYDIPYYALKRDAEVIKLKLKQLCKHLK